MICKKCESKNVAEIEQTFKNGSTHIRCECADCGEFNGFKTNDKLELFVMPFGKYERLTLGEIKKKDPAYLVWAAKTFDRGSVKNRIIKMLDK